MKERVRVEVRAYEGHEPTLVSVEHFECSSTGVSDEAAKAAWRLSRKHDGVEYVVVEADGNEDVTDTWGTTPWDLAAQAEAEDSGSWQREMAMEAGMLHGVDAYNEMMGY